MYYKIHTDRIILEDENGTRVAELDYPELRNGLCEITHVYGSDSEEGLAQADNLMDLCVREMRQSGRRVIASSKYAADWFRKHPQAQDVLIDPDSIAADRYGEFEPQSPGVQQNSSEAGSAHNAKAAAVKSPVPSSGSPVRTADTQPAKEAYIRSNAGRGATDPDDDWDRTDRILRGEAGRARGTSARRPARETPFSGSGEQRRTRIRRSAAATPVSSICGILRLISFFSMLVILFLYLISFFLHSEGLRRHCPPESADRPLSS